jgi:hypothetical protein
VGGWIAQWRETSQMPVWSYVPFQRPDFSVSNELKMKEACMEKYLEQLGACQPATIRCEPGTWDQLDETVRSWHSSVAASCSSFCLIFIFFSFFLWMFHLQSKMLASLLRDTFSRHSE